jgi:HSP20 family molecular chaperone IbpA
VDNFLDRLGRMADRMFDDLDRRLGTIFDYEEDSTLGVNRYRVNKDDKGVTITVEVPGFGPDDLEVTLDNAILTVTDKAKTPNVLRRFRVSRRTEAEDIEATVKHGLLIIRIHTASKTEAPQGSVKVTGG